MVTLLCRTLLFIEYCCQTVADRDMVIIDSLYRKSPLPHQTVPLPSPYDVPFSHNTCVTNRQADDTSYQKFNITVGQKSVKMQ